MKEKNHGYSDTNKILYVVYNYEWSFALNLDDIFIPGSRFGLPNTKKIVSTAPRNFQCSYLLISWVVQNYLLDIQCCSLCGFTDNWIKGRIQIIQLF